MDDSGIRRRVDDLGRVVIPAEYRHRLGIEVGDEVTFTLDGDHLVVARQVSRCVLCDAEDDLVTFRGRPVCQACMTALAVLAPARPEGPDAGQRLLVLKELDQAATTAVTDVTDVGDPQPASTTAW